jgi:hypothetical protein
MHVYESDSFLYKFGLILFMMYTGWRDNIQEGTFEGQPI